MASEKEGWGLTVLEAAACGTPTVAVNVPGIRDAVRDGETGLLVATAEAAPLREALRCVLEDESLRARLGTAALAWASRFTWDGVAAEVSAVLDTARGVRPPAREAAGAR
jgi:glycosyltransferase involved in cell wall biosynthesis